MVGAAQTREEWLAERRHYLGATDTASHLGFGFRTPLQVYCEKVGLPVEEPDEDSQLRMAAGLALEPVLAEAFTREFGIALKRVPSMFHPQYPFIGANLDYLSEDETTVAEMKTYGIGRRAEFGETGSDQIPNGYHIQISKQMGIARLNGFPVDRGYLYALSLGTMKVEPFIIPFDQEYFDLLVSRDVKFWREHIEAKVPPSATAKDETCLRILYPDDDGVFVLSTPEIDDLMADLVDANKIRKMACERFDGLKATMIEAIGPHAGIDTLYGRITYKQSAPTQKTDYPTLIHAAKVPAEMVSLYTTEVAGSRRFLMPKEPK